MTEKYSDSTSTIRSEHADVYNHNPWAADYDDDVRDEQNPIRAGYDACLTWVAE